MEGLASGAQDTEVLLGIGRLLGQEVNLDQFLQTLMDRVAALMQADRCTLYLLDPQRRELFSRAAHLPEIRQIRLQLGQGVAGHVALHGVPVNVPDPNGEHRFFPDIDKLTGYRTTSLLAVPLRDRAGGIFGVLQVLNRRNGPRFTPEDEALLSRIARQVSGALEATSLHAELKRAADQPAAPVGYFFNRIIGESQPMQAIYRVIQKAAATQATVLLRGESGTGKELFARALHVNSPRRNQPFVKVDCAALPASLIENELFGHEKGAFTGADQRMEGKFEAAHGGTVFIDEIGELPQSVQGKLLRVLQDRELERVGGTQTVKVDARIVAATHRDLAKMVAAGSFRQDLYYRIKVVDLELPPLRDRGPEDVERLARHFVAAAAKKHRPEAPPRLSPGALARLTAYRWPGNVRELEHCIESAVVLSEGEILPEHLPLPSSDRSACDHSTCDHLTCDHLTCGSGLPTATGLHTRRGPSTGSGETAPTGQDSQVPSGQGPQPPTGQDPRGIRPLAEVEREHILSVLEALGRNRTAAAKALGIGRNTLSRKLRGYGVTELE